MEELKQYNDLLIEYNKLKHEYSENTIIQSMNDMKHTNDLLMHKINNMTVKSEKLEKISQLMTDSCIVVDKMLDSLIKSILNSDISRYQIKTKLYFILDIVKDYKKNRQDIL